MTTTPSFREYLWAPSKKIMENTDNSRLNWTIPEFIIFVQRKIKIPKEDTPANMPPFIL